MGMSRKYIATGYIRIHINTCLDMFLKNFGCIMLKGLIIYLELRKKLGEGNGNPLQHSCLENPMDRGIWQTTVDCVAKSLTQLSD